MKTDFSRFENLPAFDGELVALVEPFTQWLLEEGTRNAGMELMEAFRSVYMAGAEAGRQVPAEYSDLTVKDLLHTQWRDFSTSHKTDGDQAVVEDVVASAFVAGAKFGAKDSCEANASALETFFKLDPRFGGSRKNAPKTSDSASDEPEVNNVPDTYPVEPAPLSVDKLYGDFEGLAKTLAINNVECIHVTFVHKGRSVTYQRGDNPWSLPQIRVSGSSAYGDIDHISFLLKSGAWESLMEKVQRQHRANDAERLQSAAKEAEEVGPLIEKIQDQVNILFGWTVKEA
jgi:hypothetical protein